MQGKRGKSDVAKTKLEGSNVFKSLAIIASYVEKIFSVAAIFVIPINARFHMRTRNRRTGWKNKDVVVVKHKFSG